MWEDWKTEIREMRRAVEIWSMLQNGDIGGLSKFIQWEEHKDGGQSQWVYWTHPELKGGTNQALFSLLQSGEQVSMIGIPPVPGLFQDKTAHVFMPASFLLQRWINHHLKGAASPQLRYDIKLDKRVVQIIPDSLIAAMWLQFAQAFAGNRKYRACKACGRWFEISTEGSGFRVNRQFCSDACKSKDYRERREQAKRAQREPAATNTPAKKSQRISKRKG